MKLRIAAVAAACTSITLLAGPAGAQQAVLDDPAGDAAGPGLDITRVTVSNLDHAVVAKVRFVRAVRGDVVVSVDRRGGRGLRMVSEHRPAGHTDDFVLRGAFTDRSIGADQLRCPGLRVRWDAEHPTATLRLPASCLHGGDYGAVRVAVLTERGSDTDVAPEDRPGSAWIPRG